MSSGQREMVYCHQCEKDWYRDEHGLICPYPDCRSEFVEVIEPDHDPREPDEDDEPMNFPALAAISRFSPVPRNVPDPDEGDISHLQVHSTGPHSYSITGTIYRSYNPRQGGAGSPHPMESEVMTNFSTLMAGLMGANMASRAGGAGPQGPGPLGAGPLGAGPLGTGSRFQYSPNARLSPRDPNNPQPNAQPVDDLSNILNSLFAGIQDPQAGSRSPNQPGQMPPNPLANLMSMVFGPGMRSGDVAHSQEQFDRIVSQLMEQNATGNAPPPANQQDIATLPKRQIEGHMLDENGKAECTICMDEVKLGDTVTMLYCDHWFHEPCVSAWLQEHNTCPHCRKSIQEGLDAHLAKEQSQASNSRTSSSRKPSHSREPPSPGAGSSGSGGGGGGGGGGGIRDRFRNFLSRP